ncbi:MAG: hypothetical protein QGH37_25260 [Candidatus Poribacteria bacterium]|jgi:hypothetical protein|nr:hypothetical protein [Candidatus Poribacteria bacterium]MDP6999195.1 hypothetical protein [Candidatus Poribacteria bacterium]
MLKEFISVLIALMVFVPISIAGTLIEDFDDGDNEGWERSPQNKDSKAFWGVDKKEKAMKFDPKGVGWKEAISQMNFVGTDQVKNVREWKDYDVEVDIKLTEAANFPGGPRGRVDLKTGGHYVVWLYPTSGELKLYKNPGWDINAGLETVGAGKFKPKVDEYHKVKLSMRGSDIKVYYDGNLEIEAKDKSHKQGTIAVGSQDRVVYFDNIKVEGPDIPNTDMSSVEPEGKLTSIWARIKTDNR